jgi:SAM-dependent methyltransferase
MNEQPTTDFSPAYFERMAALEDSHPWTASMRTLALDLLQRYGTAQRRRMLDVGCGTGGFLKDWQTTASAGQWIGVDLFPEALTLARDRCRASLSAASAAALPFGDALFDAIYCADVLQHMSRADSMRALDEFARVLDQGGLLALRVRGTPSLSESHDRDFSHGFTPAGLRAALAARHFEILFLSRVNALPSVLAELRQRDDAHHVAHAPVKHIAVRAEGDAKSRLLGVYLAAERMWLSVARFGLPFGHTIMCVARRQATRR